MAELGQAPKRYAYVDALRGYAVLGVISVHTAQRIPEFHGPLRQLAEGGQYGVQLFFVASALTLLMSWHARSEGKWPFYARRAFRIAPMFWLAIALYYAIYGLGARYWAPSGVSVWDIATTATFLHGWHPRTINSVVPGGWSIAVEMTFYAVFPVMALWLRSLARAIAAFLCAALLASLLNPVVQQWGTLIWPDEPRYLVFYFTYFWIVNQLPVFLTGFVSFFVLRQYAIPRAMAWLGLVFTLALLILITFADVPGPMHLKCGVCFGAIAAFLGCGAGKGIVNLGACWLGKISYSAYLWHFAVLELAVFAIARTGGWEIGLSLSPPSKAKMLYLLLLSATVLSTAALSAITYRLVEQPIIAWGNALIRKRQARE